MLEGVKIKGKKVSRSKYARNNRSIEKEETKHEYARNRRNK